MTDRNGSGSKSEVTQLLLAWRGGNDHALEKLTRAVYDELHRLAGRFMAREQPGQTLQATALVNEAYLRLVDIQQVTWQNRAHFFKVAAKVMRQILIDSARARGRGKRGGGIRPDPLDEALVVSRDLGIDVEALHGALDRLSAQYPRKAEVVEMRYFGGLEFKEIAEALGVSPKTINLDWRFAKAWLHKDLRGGDRHGA